MAFTIPAARPRRRRRRWTRLPVVLLSIVALTTAGAVVLWLGRGDSAQPSPTPTTSAPDARGPAASDAVSPRFARVGQLLAGLPIKGFDRAQDYKRYRFGPGWSDEVNVEFGHNGCNTRDDILRRDLANLVVRPGTCYADRGILHDPYTGATIDFVRGPATSNSVEIDHLVSLADAWYKGARSWDDQRRLDFANDPRNLLAVDPQANFTKAFRDAAAWLPPNAAFRCEFVARQVEVKSAYGLWVAEKEKRAMGEVLANC